MQRSKGLISDIRVITLLLFVLAALIAIYVYPPPPADAGLNGNLQYGLDLVGGSSLQLKLNGTLVGIDAPEDVNESRVASYLSDALDTEVRPYRTARGEIKYEIRKSVTTEQLADALKGINATIAKKPDGKLDFEEGVTRETRDETRRIIETKLNMLGLASTRVRTAGSNLLVIDLAGIDIKTAESLVGEPGKFEIRIQTNGTGGEIKVGEHLSEIENITEHVVYGSEGIRSVRMVPQRSKSGSWGAPFTLTEKGATALRDAAIKYGALDNPRDHELVMLLDNVVVYSGPLDPNLAEELRNAPVYSLISETGVGDEGLKRARELIIHLKAGALPVNVQVIGSGEVPAYLGMKFKKGALIAGLLALIAVTIVVAARYREKRIILPMFFGLLSEVILILGIVATMNWLTIGMMGILLVVLLIGALLRWWKYPVTDLTVGVAVLLVISVFILSAGKWQLDLPSIAGIIAVIGTGVDQMVIITDEVLSGGRSSSMYHKRISFAYGIIFASAATTIVAMLALAFMALGTLRSLAIVTIIGLMIGIFITRPAYARIIELLV
ncbi:MAG: preprotein translocase subunit SecD [Candidatus Methanophagaceae archaeon]|nr:MAG: preprotein translocase subunit SecD [Methanophagales archaeon]